MLQLKAHNFAFINEKNTTDMNGTLLPFTIRSKGNHQITVSDFTPSLPTFSTKYDVATSNFDNCENSC